MKRISMFIAMAVLVAVMACHRTETPVDKYVALLDKGTEQAEKISSLAELMDVDQIISPAEAMQIKEENADYILTDEDKEKLKKSYDRLLTVAYEKTIEFGGLSEKLKSQTKTQSKLVIEAANRSIDAAKTMGDL